MAGAGQRRRPQKYPKELPVRMVLEFRQRTDERRGTETRLAKELGIGIESLRQW